MGVTGSGKTTVGKVLAEALGCRFLEGDDFHPPANVAKMSAGVPLDDADRAPWLEAIRAEISRNLADGATIVVACSALRQCYRDILAAGDKRVFFAHLAGSPELVATRLAGRSGHFMPPALLSSQYATLEPPAGRWFDIRMPPHDIAAAIQHALACRDAGGGGRTSAELDS